MDIVPPYNVVITGGSKGVGRALAAGFVRAGDNVVLCGRSSESLLQGSYIMLVCLLLRCLCA